MRWRRQDRCRWEPVNDAVGNRSATRRIVTAACAPRSPRRLRRRGRSPLTREVVSHKQQCCRSSSRGVAGYRLLVRWIWTMSSKPIRRKNSTVARRKARSNVDPKRQAAIRRPEARVPRPATGMRRRAADTTSSERSRTVRVASYGTRVRYKQAGSELTRNASRSAPESGTRPTLLTRRQTTAKSQTTPIPRASPAQPRLVDKDGARRPWTGVQRERRNTARSRTLRNKDGRAEDGQRRWSKAMPCRGVEPDEVTPTHTDEVRNGTRRRGRIVLLRHRRRCGAQTLNLNSITSPSATT